MESDARVEAAAPCTLPGALLRVFKTRNVLIAHSDRVEGIVRCSPRTEPGRILKAAGAAPLVVVNGEIDGVTSAPVDDDLGVQQAIDHLAALGHRQSAYVQGPSGSWVKRDVVDTAHGGPGDR